MLTVEHNGLDIEKISPEKGAKYSPNLYKWLKEKKSRSWSSRVYVDKDKTLWIGILDGRELIGSKLIGVLCNGHKEESFAYQRVDATEVPDFWANYMADGRCAIDPEHAMYFVGDDSRWVAEGGHRSCQWCHKATQRLVQTTRTIAAEKWISE